MKRSTCKLLFALAALSTTFVARPVSAVTTTLTGGDSTDGLSLTGTFLGAIYSNTSGARSTTGALTLQGYTFTPYTAANFTAGAVVSNISIAAAAQPSFGVNTFVAAESPTNAGFTNPTTPSANDTTLINLVNSGLFFEGGTNTLTFTISGLTAGNSYNLSFLTCATGYAARTEGLSINGVALDTINVTNTMAIYATTNTAVALANGTITATLTPGTDGDFTNALIVTAVPEPSTWAMMLGGLGLLITARSLRRRVA